MSFFSVFFLVVNPNLEGVKKTWVLFWLTISAWDFCWAPTFEPLSWGFRWVGACVWPALLLYSHYVFVHTDVQDICIKPLNFRFSDGLSDRLWWPANVLAHKFFNWRFSSCCKKDIHWRWTKFPSFQLAVSWRFSGYETHVHDCKDQVVLLTEGILHHLGCIKSCR